MLLSYQVYANDEPGTLLLCIHVLHSMMHVHVFSIVTGRRPAAAALRSIGETHSGPSRETKAISRGQPSFFGVGTSNMARDVGILVFNEVFIPWFVYRHYFMFTMNGI